MMHTSFRPQWLAAAFAAAAPAFPSRKLRLFRALPAALLLLLAACNKDGEITEEIPETPIIELDSETGVYTAKVGREVTIAPAYRYAEEAAFSWTAGGVLLSDQPALRYTWETPGDVYLLLHVENKNGFAEEELKVEVLALTPPVISLVLPPEGLKVEAGTEYTFAPDFAHDDVEGFRVEWLRDGKVVGTERTYVFREATPGRCLLTIRASNIDGTTEREVAVEVVEAMPRTVGFPALSYFQPLTNRSTLVGRGIDLKPFTTGFDRPQYSWTVDGAPVSCTDRTFRFTPAAPGSYRVAVTVTEGASAPQALTKHLTRGAEALTAEVVVRAAAKSEAELLRAKEAGSSKVQNKVYEYVPAPGQFIGGTRTGGFTGAETTHARAVEWALQRLAGQQFVSLGGFGGYLIVGFDHSIVNRGGAGYDFAVQGNAFLSTKGGSNEAGIVWVMQDTNGNGLPDDEWYELKGSETGREGTLQEYAVTYYRPAGARMDVPWTDSEGGKGSIDYLKTFHDQDFYYPAWIEAESYTLRGTRLPAQNRLDPATGYWANDPYGWGYADNVGSDDLGGADAATGDGQCCGFRIANAIRPDGTPIELQYIDFVKVQVGVNAKSGPLGEVSTEVFSFRDLSM